MKSSDKIFARMVRQAMNVLMETDIPEYLGNGPTVIAKASADIVAAILQGSCLIHEGEVRLLAGPPLRAADVTNLGTVLWEVTTIEDYDEQTCRWCDRPYGTGDPGGQHRLCKFCYKDGPPEL